MTDIMHSRGTKIYCIENNHLIGEFVSDMNVGHIPTNLDILWEEGKEVFAGDLLKCNECGSWIIHLLGLGFFYFNTKKMI
jgi:hypothetical protein